MTARPVSSRARRPRWTAAVVLACTLATGLPAQDDTLPAPPEVVQRFELRNQVRKAFSPHYADPSADGPRALVAALLEQGRAAANAADMRFVLLDEARSVAQDEGLFEQTFEAIDELEAGWQIDGHPMRVEALEAFARGLRDPDASAAWLEQAFDVATEALDRESVTIAGRLQMFAVRVLRQVKDPLVAGSAKPRLDVLTDRLRAHRAYQLFRDRLKNDPADARANTVVGQHLCLVRNDWETGLPLLLKGNDDALRELAEIELKEEKSADVHLWLAERWLSQARQERDALRLGMARRTVHWCEKAAPHVTGLREVAARQRMAEAYKLAGLPVGYGKLSEQQRNDLVRMGNKWFLFVDLIVTRDAADAWCRERGATLASVANAQENQLLLKLVHKRRPVFEAFWIGGSDAENEGEWKWDDGTPFRYTNWNRGEPNNIRGREHYQQMRRNGRWNDVHPTYRKTFVAQWIID